MTECMQRMIRDISRSMRRVLHRRSLRLAGALDQQLQNTAMLVADYRIAEHRLYKLALAPHRKLQELVRQSSLALCRGGTDPSRRWLWSVHMFLINICTLRRRIYCSVLSRGWVLQHPSNLHPPPSACRQYQWFCMS